MMKYFKLVKARKNAEKGLNKDYASDFRVVKAYLNEAFQLTYVEREEILNEILDMFLIAQEENKDVYEMFGGNYSNFCEAIVSEYCRDNIGVRIISEGFLILSVFLFLVFSFNAVVEKTFDTYTTTGVFAVPFIVIALMIMGYVVKNLNTRIVIAGSIGLLSGILGPRLEKTLGYNIFGIKIYLSNFWPYFIAIILVTTVLVYIRNNKNYKEKLRKI